MKKGLIFAAIGLLVLSVTAVAAALWVSPKGASNGDAVSVVILPGASGQEIARQLEDHNVIRSSTAFRIYMRLVGIGADLKAGEYELRENMAFSDLVEILRKGPTVRFVRLIIPEGLNVEQTADRVAAQTHISKEEFLQAATTATIVPKVLNGVSDPRVIPQTPSGTMTLEGVLYPNTYFVSEKETAASLVQRLAEQFEKETSDIDWNRAGALGLTPYQALVVASLIEEEAKLDEERSMVSAVIHNRLKLGMKLEIDATVQFLVRKYGGEKLTQSDLAVDSPYNTRLYAGLPPGPLSSPGLASIEAALQPAQSDALFYVLKPDCRSHEFTTDYDEFLNARRQAPQGC